ncbi:TPA: hypothetical protein DEA21_04555 [Candidatus Uhrbacteria bacterium]|nr:hypothetical protein [Candidatus Uhrbacteria bacterium]
MYTECEVESPNEALLTRRAKWDQKRANQKIRAFLFSESPGEKLLSRGLLLKHRAKWNIIIKTLCGLLIFYKAWLTVDIIMVLRNRNQKIDC